jgi:PTS system mannose-specific IIB component
MPVVLARIDDRLIHGQVTVGWSERLQPDRIVLADNAIAADPWQSRVYASTVPPPIAVSVESVAKTAARLRADASRDERIILLTGSPAEMVDLVRSGASLPRVNVGGLHYSAGKREMLPYVFLDQHDLAALRRLRELDIELFAQQVPGGREHALGYAELEEMGTCFP